MKEQNRTGAEKREEEKNVAVRQRKRSGKERRRKKRGRTGVRVPCPQAGEVGGWAGGGNERWAHGALDCCYSGRVRDVVG